MILILPEEFFRNCAILILALLLVWCAILIAADLWAGKRRKRQAKIAAVAEACGGDCSRCSGCQ